MQYARSHFPALHDLLRPTAMTVRNGAEDTLASLLPGRLDDLHKKQLLGLMVIYDKLHMIEMASKVWTLRVEWESVHTYLCYTLDRQDILQYVNRHILRTGPPNNHQYQKHAALEGNMQFMHMYPIRGRDNNIVGEYAVYGNNEDVVRFLYQGEMPVTPTALIYAAHNDNDVILKHLCSQPTSQEAIQEAGPYILQYYPDSEKCVLYLTTVHGVRRAEASVEDIDDKVDTAIFDIRALDRSLHQVEWAVRT